MAKVSKHVNRGIPSNERTQSFSEADVSTGDIIDVIATLGRAGQNILIEASGDISIRFNVLLKVYKPRGLNDGLADMQIEGPNLTTEVEIEDTTQGVIALGAGDTFELDKDFPIKDIKMVDVSGSFTMFVS